MTPEYRSTTSAARLSRFFRCCAGESDVRANVGIAHGQCDLMPGRPVDVHPGGLAARASIVGLAANVTPNLEIAELVGPGGRIICGASA
jgi:hypothetical protein